MCIRDSSSGAWKRPARHWINWNPPEAGHSRESLSLIHIYKVERGYIGELFAVTASAQFGDKPLPGIDACGRDVVSPVVLRPQFQCARPTPPVNEEAHRAQPCEGCGASVGGNPPLYGFCLLYTSRCV